MPYNNLYGTMRVRRAHSGLRLTPPRPAPAGNGLGADAARDLCVHGEAGMPGPAASQWCLRAAGPPPSRAPLVELSPHPAGALCGVLVYVVLPEPED